MDGVWFIQGTGLLAVSQGLQVPFQHHASIRLSLLPGVLFPFLRGRPSSPPSGPCPSTPTLLCGFPGSTWHVASLCSLSARRLCSFRIMVPGYLYVFLMTLWGSWRAETLSHLSLSTRQLAQGLADSRDGIDVCGGALRMPTQTQAEFTEFLFSQFPPSCYILDKRSGIHVPIVVEKTNKTKTSFEI